MDRDEHYTCSTKRRRVSQPQGDAVKRQTAFSADGSQTPAGTRDVCDEDGQENISIDATSKVAGQAVAPFLAKHIPGQYAPMGRMNAVKSLEKKDLNTKFCYRHRPDLKCRRQANEPSMAQLQNGLHNLSQEDQQAIAHVWSLFSAAPSKHRHLMLQGILTQCCFSQLSYLASNVRELIRIDFLTALPTELSFKILCHLDTISLCKAAQVSRRWRSLADDDVVWHRMCEQHIDRRCEKCGWGLPLLEKSRLRSSKREIQLRSQGKDLHTPETIVPQHPETPIPTPQEDITTPAPAPGQDDSYFAKKIRPWKEVYKDRFLVGSNWKYGRCTIKTFRGHENGIMCLQFDDQILATGSYDCTIKIWNVNEVKEIRTLRGHTQPVRCLQFDGSKLISGSLDSTIKVWNYRTGECLSTYRGHTDAVIGLHLDSTLLATGSKDRTIKIWNFGEKDKSTFSLRGHKDDVNAVRIDQPSRTLLSASDDCTVKLWDLDSRTCIKTFKGHVGIVQQVVPLPHDFEFDEDDHRHHRDSGSDHEGHSPASLAVSSVEASPSPSPSPEEPPTTDTTSSFLFPDQDQQAQHHYGPGFANDPSRPLPPRYMLTGALDSTIRLWDVQTSKCLRTFFGHVEGIWALAADSLRIVSGAEDRMVKVWDPRSGSCERTYTGHAGPVTCIGLSDRVMATGGEDCEVRMYQF